MPRYPTEVTHGPGGYRNGRSSGLSTGGPGPSLGFLAPGFGAPIVIVPPPTTPAPAPVVRPLPWRPMIGPIGVGIGLAAAVYYVWQAAGSAPGTASYTFPSGWNPLCGDPNNATHWRWINEPRTFVGSAGLAEDSGAGGSCAGGVPNGEIKIADHLPQMNPGNYGNGSLYCAGYGSPRVDPVTLDPDVSLYDVQVIMLNLTGTAPSAYPTLNPSTQLVPGYGQPLTFPNEHPDLAPMMWPATPVPQSWEDAVADPEMQPAEDPLTRPSPATSPTVPMPFPLSPPVVVLPPTVPRPGVAPLPPTVPSVVVSPTPDGGLGPPTTVPPPAPTDRRPPGDRTVERKVSVRSLQGGFIVAINAATEILDFVDSMHDAIKHLSDQRCAPHDYVCKLEVIYENFDNPQFDAAAFVESWLNNQFEDWAFGRLGRAQGGASAGIGVTTGVGRGTRGGGDHIGDLVDDQGNPVEVGPGPLPQLNYDEATGEWTLSWFHWSTPGVGG